MNLSTVRHTGAYPDLYLKDRKTISLTVHTASDDVQKATLVCFSRTDVNNRKRIPMELYVRDDLQDHFNALVGFEDTVRYLKYYFEFVDREGNPYYLDAWGIGQEVPKDSFFEFLYANETNVLRIPEWSKGQIYYQIFPERFNRGTGIKDTEIYMPWGTEPTRENYMGGDIEGITTKLDYIQDLGIDCIYMNPIFKADFNHKYATTDYFEIDPQFGSNDDFANMVAEIHKRNIKVVLDGVFNHSGVNFFAFQDLLQNQENSAYKNWFYVRSYPVVVSETNSVYECVGDYGYMPKLNTGNPEVQDYILKVMLYWLREYQIDGWRLDVADEIDAGLWTRARLEVKNQFPNALLLGETWGNGLTLMDGKQMDSMMNYVFRDAIRDYIAYERIDGKKFADRLNRMLSNYPEEMNLGMFLVLDTHDTERFINFCDGNKDKLKLAALLQMSFVGAPSIYYGDEIGITGENDPDCRKCMIWDEEDADLNLLQYYKYLTQIRKREESIKTGKFAVNLCERRLFGFVRYNSSEEIYVICNAGSEAEHVELPVMYNAEYEDLLTGDIIQADKVQESVHHGNIPYNAILKLDLNSLEGKIIKRRKNNEVS